MTVTIENLYTGNGSTTNYSFTFPYLDTPDIKTSLGGVVHTNFRLLNATTVQFVNNTTDNTPTAPGNGVAIRIYRETAYVNPKATFYPGSAIRAGDLNDNTLQNLYVTQEANDKVARAWLKGDMTIDSSETWYTTDDEKIATTKAIDGRIDTKIDSALTDDVIAGTSIAIADDTPSSGKITVNVTAATTSAAGSMSAADKTKLDGVEAGATADQTNAEIRTAVEAASDSNVFTDADHTKLNAIEASATADQTAAEIKTLYESNAETNPLTDAEKLVIDGVTANTSEINKLDGYTGSVTNLNIVSGKTFRASGDGTLSTTSDTEIPSSKVIAAHVASSQTAIGGFVTIANEASFPTTANQPANGVIVSISDAADTVINGSGVSTTGRTTDGTPATVTINNFPSSLNGETLATGVGMLVTSTGSSNTYNYHKILAAETDVKSLSDDINDFNARYRVANSAPGSNNDEGDLYFDKTANKMKVYNGSSWDDVASVGSFYINTLASSGSASDSPPGGSATFDGTAKKFTLSNPPSGGAAQLIVSINGVIQKPNNGSSVPSEGFAISGNDIIFSTAPASGSDYHIITQGSSVSIGIPSANSVNSSHIIDGSIVDADISGSAAISESKLGIHNAPSDGQFLKYTTSNGMEWAIAGDSDAIRALAAQSNSTFVQAIDTGTDGRVVIELDGGEKARFTGDGLAIGTTTLGSGMSASANHLGLKNSHHCGMTIIAGDDDDCNINFTDEDRNMAGAIKYSNDGDYLALYTDASERFRIASAGQLGIGGATYGTSGQVLTSGGSGAAPSWTTISAAPAISTLLKTI